MAKLADTAVLQKEAEELKKKLQEAEKAQQEHETLKELRSKQDVKFKEALGVDDLVDVEELSADEIQQDSAVLLARLYKRVDAAFDATRKNLLALVVMFGCLFGFLAVHHFSTRWSASAPAGGNESALAEKVERLEAENSRLTNESRTLFNRVAATRNAPDASSAAPFYTICHGKVLRVDLDGKKPFVGSNCRLATEAEFKAWEDGT